MSKPAKLWRCHNCPTPDGKGHHEWAGEPKCPICTLSRLDPGGGGLIVERTPIHYVSPHPIIKNRGCGRRACDGKPTGGSICTGEVAAVTCPDCLSTPVVQDTRAEQGLPVVVPEHDYVVNPEIDSEEVANGP